MLDEGLEGNETPLAGLLGPLSAPLLPPELPADPPPVLQSVNWPCSKASWVVNGLGEGLRGLGERISDSRHFSSKCATWSRAIHLGDALEMFLLLLSEARSLMKVMFFLFLFRTSCIRWLSLLTD